jgi:16S rRNA (cytosine1402-N4)-methyltransferase
MNRTFTHRPVMLDEVVDIFATVPEGILIDATVGGGGHAAALLDANAALSVVGLDQDPAAVAAASSALAPYGQRAAVVRARFDELAEVTGSEGAPVVGVLFDLGVSSPQLDWSERGFSFRQGGPLDMRMDPSASLTAADVINGYPVERLTSLIAQSGETRLAARIARAIVAARPVADTAQLAAIVADAVPAALRRRGHPARRVFQAVRIEVNDELGVLERALVEVPNVLVPGGRCCVLSYHSGEDRLVKRTFVDWATGGCTCPPGLPCVCGAVARARLLNRGARKPSPAEVAANPRAEAARLRAIEWLGAA